MWLKFNYTNTKLMEFETSFGLENKKNQRLTSADHERQINVLKTSMKPMSDLSKII